MPPSADAALQRTLRLAIEADRVQTAEKDQLTADLKAVTAELAAATELTNALMLERDAALERAKLAEDQRRVLEMQLATKDFELETANRRADLAEEEYYAAWGILNRLQTQEHSVRLSTTPMNHARRFDAEEEGGDNANAGVSVHVCERPPGL